MHTAPPGLNYPTRRRFLVLLCAGGGASLLAACQPTLPASPTAASLAPQTQPAPQAAPAGLSSNQLIVMQSADANTLDPQFRSTVPEFNINLNIFQLMLWRNSHTLNIEPEFIQEWKLVDDLTWEFKLPGGVTFQDGTPADAEAVAFSLTRQAKQQIGGKPTVQGSSWGRLSNFESAQAVTSTLVRMRTTSPAATVPALLAALELVPPSQYTDESASNLAKISTAPVGSGPYRLAEWVKDDHLTLEAFDGYVGRQPAFKTVIFKPVAEVSTRVLAVENGQADIVVSVAPDQATAVERSQKAHISSVVGGRNVFVGMRCDHPLLADTRVRQAFNYAFNFDAVNRALLNGVGTRTRTIINPPHEPPDARAYPYDPDRAKALLAEVGWQPGPDGVLSRNDERFVLQMMTPGGRYIKDKEIAQAVQQDLGRIGVQVDLQLVEWSLYSGDILAKRNPSPLYLFGLGAPFDGQAELNYLHKDFQNNSTYWSNPEYHALFAQLQGTLDEQQRQALMNRLSAIAYADPPWIYVWHQVDFYGVSKRVQWDAAATERIRAAEARLA